MPSARLQCLIRAFLGVCNSMFDAFRPVAIHDSFLPGRMAFDIRRLLAGCNSLFVLSRAYAIRYSTLLLGCNSLFVPSRAYAIRCSLCSLQLQSIIDAFPGVCNSMSDAFQMVAIRLVCISLLFIRGMQFRSIAQAFDCKCNNIFTRFIAFAIHVMIAPFFFQ